MIVPAEEGEHRDLEKIQNSGRDMDPCICVLVYS